jgi:hypothetical protein
MVRRVAASAQVSRREVCFCKKLDFMFSGPSFDGFGCGAPAFANIPLPEREAVLRYCLIAIAVPNGRCLG